jgi:putative endonuclease
MSWHVYLLTCADGTLYCGVTSDLDRRLAEHNGEAPGQGAKYTRVRRPVALAAHAPCADKSAALRLEIAVKKRPRAAKLAFLLAQQDAASAMAVASSGAPIAPVASPGAHIGVPPEACFSAASGAQPDVLSGIPADIPSDVPVGALSDISSDVSADIPTNAAAHHKPSATPAGTPCPAKSQPNGGVA